MYAQKTYLVSFDILQCALCKLRCSENFQIIFIAFLVFLKHFIVQRYFCFKKHTKRRTFNFCMWIKSVGSFWRCHQKHLECFSRLKSLFSYLLATFIYIYRSFVSIFPYPWVFERHAVVPSSFDVCVNMCRIHAIKLIQIFIKLQLCWEYRTHGDN